MLVSLSLFPVVQAGQDFTYLLAILAGFGLMGFLFYSVGSEFFSSTSPSSIFTKALKRVRADDRVRHLVLLYNDIHYVFGLG